MVEKIPSSLTGIRHPAAKHRRMPVKRTKAGGGANSPAPHRKRQRPEVSLNAENKNR